MSKISVENAFIGPDGREPYPKLYGMTISQRDPVGISRKAVIHPVMSSFRRKVAGRPVCVWSNTLPLISFPR